jgi:hypothetical protein
MKIFVSWSGLLSRRVAELLRDWLPNVLQSIQPWVSFEDIDKGKIWFGDISDTIGEAALGIVCLSKDNLNARWILFEAGGLAQGIAKDRVCTLLIDVEPSQVEPPLSQFNATKIVKEDVFQLIKTINKSCGENALSEQRLLDSFEIWWPRFEEKFNDIKKSVPRSGEPVTRRLDDVAAEILETVRSIQKSVQGKSEPPIGMGTRLAAYLASRDPHQEIVPWPNIVDENLLQAALPDFVKASNGAISEIQNGPSGFIMVTSYRILTQSEEERVRNLCSNFGRGLTLRLSSKPPPG